MAGVAADLRGANYQVDITGRRGGHPHAVHNIGVHIFPASQVSKVSGDTASRYTYAVHWDPRVRLDDGSPVQIGDRIVWSEYPDQNLALGDLTIATAGQGRLTVYTGFFMPIATEGPS